MKTHADVVTMLREKESTLRDRFAVREMGLVSSRVEYKPVSAVRLFVVGPEPAAFGPLESYLAAELDLAVDVIAKTSANGTFRHIFPPPREKAAAET